MAGVGNVFHVEFGLNETKLTQALESHRWREAERIILDNSQSSFLDEGQNLDSFLDVGRMSF